MHWFIEGVLWIVLMVALVVVSPLIVHAGDGKPMTSFVTAAALLGG
jgi:hypothetical protein